MSGYGKTHGFHAAFQTAFSVAWAAVIVFVVAGRESAAYQPNLANPAPKKTDKELQVEAFASQIRLRMQKSEWDQAIQESNKAIELDPNDGTAYLMRGMAFNGKGEYDNAIKDFDKVTAQNGRDPVAVANRADAYASRSVSLYQKGEYLKAVDSAYFAILEKSDHFEAHKERPINNFSKSGQFGSMR